jgi:hypothetical protein
VFILRAIGASFNPLLQSHTEPEMGCFDLLVIGDPLVVIIGGT